MGMTFRAVGRVEPDNAQKALNTVLGADWKSGQCALFGTAEVNCSLGQQRSIGGLHSLPTWAPTSPSGHAPSSEVWTKDKAVGA